MLITKDVALITFVPLGVMVLTQARKQKLLIPSSYCRRGRQSRQHAHAARNPQNLYLYSVFNMTFRQVLGLWRDSDRHSLSDALRSPAAD
jgi:hypothetical protein